MAYSNLALVEAELKSQSDNPEATQVVEGKAYIITSALEWVTKRIDAICFQEFEPRFDTRYFDATPSMNLDPYLNALTLDQPLLEARTVKVVDTTLTQWAPPIPQSQRTNYNFYAYPVNETPYWKLQATQTFALWMPFLWSPTTFAPQSFLQIISVYGIWGYKKHYPATGWRTTPVEIQAALLADYDDITVVLADAAAAARFSPGMLLSFDDDTDEMCALELVTSVAGTPGTYTLTVERGVRGTEAEAHADNTPLRIWYPEANIVRAATRWCAYLYQRRAVYESVQVTLGAGSGGIAAAFPQDAPEEIQGILGHYVNYQFAKA